MYIPCNLKFMKKRPEAVARSWWISQKIYFITFKSYISQQYFLVKTFFLNQSMTSQWPPKIVPIHTGHPVCKCTKHEEDCADFCVLLRKSELYFFQLIFSTQNSNSTTEILYYYRQGHQRETRSVSPVVYYFGDLLPIGLWLIHLLRFRWPGFGFRTHDGSLVKSWSVASKS